MTSPLFSPSTGRTRCDVPNFSNPPKREPVHARNPEWKRWQKKREHAAHMMTRLRHAGYLTKRGTGKVCWHTELHKKIKKWMNAWSRATDMCDKIAKRLREENWKRQVIEREVRPVFYLGDNAFITRAEADRIMRLPDPSEKAFDESHWMSCIDWAKMDEQTRKAAEPFIRTFNEAENVVHFTHSPELTIWKYRHLLQRTITQKPAAYFVSCDFAAGPDMARISRARVEEMGRKIVYTDYSKVEEICAERMGLTLEQFRALPPPSPGHITVTGRFRGKSSVVDTSGL